MQQVSIDEVFPLFHSCFPNVSKNSLIQCQQWMHFYMYEKIAFCCIYAYDNGLIIQYLGIDEKYRGKGFCKKIIDSLRAVYPKLDLYGECEPNSKMHEILLRNNWKRVPIDYSCPAWGDEPKDTNLDLLVLPVNDTPKDIIGFLTNFYSCGFSSDIDQLLNKYIQELSI